jgi:hypothetical protein
VGQVGADDAPPVLSLAIADLVAGVRGSRGRERLGVDP